MKAPKLDREDIADIYELCTELCYLRNDPGYSYCQCEGWDPGGQHPCPHIVEIYLAQFDWR